MYSKWDGGQTMDSETIASRLAEIKADVLAAAHKTDGTAYEQVRALGLAVHELIKLLEAGMSPTRFYSDPGVAVPGTVGNEAQKADVAANPVTEPTK
jgi:hypothetical protein